MVIVFIQNIKNKKKDSFCASYCLYIIFLTNVFGKDFKSAVSILYYQMVK